MTIGISENIKQSFAFTKENLIGKILNWVILFVIALLSSQYLTSFIPDYTLALILTAFSILIQIILYGIIMRIYAGGEVTFAHFGTLIKKGFGYFVVYLVYCLPSFILMGVSVAVMLIPLSINPEAALTGAAAGMMILIPALILLFLASLIITPAAVNYAHSTSLGGAFRISEIFARIDNAGWGVYIFSFLIFAVIGMVLSALTYIPYAGVFIFAIIISFMNILQAKYFANLLS